jgi:hypothetical protein
MVSLLSVVSVAVWIFTAFLFSTTSFVWVSVMLLGIFFTLSYSYGIPLCRTFADERLLCVLGLIAVALALGVSVGVRWLSVSALVLPISALVFLEASSLIVRTSYSREIDDAFAKALN